MVGIQKGAGDNFVVGALVKVRGMVTEWQGQAAVQGGQDQAHRATRWR